MDENQVLGSHSLIVEPVSFGLLIKQPLSKEHTRMIPTTIEGMLEAIKVSCRMHSSNKYSEIFVAIFGGFLASFSKDILIKADSPGPW